MPYGPEQVSTLMAEHSAVLADLQELLLNCVVQGQSTEEPKAREHLLHGAARRLGVLRKAVQNVFERFPPATEQPLVRDSLTDVQINLHAFVMNLFGIFDNWAWAFLFRHNLFEQVGNPRMVGLFINTTTQYLPQALKSYLCSAHIASWYQEYLRNYRDALAHRIPLYMPPAMFTPEEGEHYNRLETGKVECIKSRKWERLDQINDEQAGVGKPCLTFLHSFSGESATKPILLHPQMLSDARAVVEFGGLYFQHWHERA